MAVLLFSCSSHKDTACQQHIPPPQPDEPQIQNPFVYNPGTESSNQRKIIVQHAVKNLGMPYKWGEQSPKTGFDCSGLVVYTHKKADIITPRTAKAQFDNGRPVSKKNLQIADLVFFKGHEKNKSFHAGIYIGDGIFVHAPGKGRQVTYGYLSNPYFKKYYIGSRSYL